MRSLISAIMNKFKLYFILFCSAILLFSCNKSDSVSAIPIRNFDTQYNDDIAIIEDYLNTHYLEVTTSTGTDDQDVEIKKIDAGQTKMMDLLFKADGDYPLLRKVPVVIKEVTYYMYYIKLRADNSDANSLAPSKADEILTAYNGSYLAYVTTDEPLLDENGNQVIIAGIPQTVTVTKLQATQFQYVPFPSGYLRMDTAVRGWRETIPLFKSGTRVESTGPNPYANFGAGLLFIPSGLAYFNEARPGIPSYSPLVFSFKLFDVKFGDQDEDGIISNDEDLDGNKDFSNDDTDGDGIPNLYDKDDDGDGFFTRSEITINGVLPASYTQILDCSGTTTGVKKHLDKTCH